MKLRLATAVGLAAVMSMGTLSHAAAPVCNLVVDDKGDGDAPAADALDIVSADIASDAKNITGVIRLAKYSANEGTAPLGVNYQIVFTGQGGDAYVFLALISVPNGNFFQYGHNAGTNDTGDGAATGVIDAAKSEIRITAPIAALSEHGNFKPGAKITGINVVVARWIGAYVNDGAYAGLYGPGDAAEGAKAYVGGTKSCVVVGK
ncbi:MAG: hypothetical protein ABR520_06945 [Mycobacteriales bacterium]|nr:hypothetical protein [Frankia sp.]